jgi:hypothetical protein
MRFAVLIPPGDGHFIAGFIEGEGHFGIVSMNGGQSLGCVMRLAVRDDDGDLLRWLVATTGIGKLSRKPAQSTSQPQVLWSVNRQDDCDYLVALLDRFPMRGRKACEFTIWSRAVRTWTQQTGPRRRATLERLKSELEACRQFPARSPTRRRFPWSETLPYLAGFIAAEGSFGASDGAAPRLTVNLRADDGPLLHLLADASGWGSVTGPYPNSRGQPHIRWTITRTSHVEDVVDCFSRVGLRGRKQLALDAWRDLVDERRQSRIDGRRPDEGVYGRARASLSAANGYPGPPDPRSLSRTSDKRYLVIEALTECGRQYGRFTCGEYQTARREHPHWPHRNTIARLFGSWAAAMEAAGLGDQVARRDLRPKDRTWAEERLRETRRVVLAAVERCAAELGRTPAAMEFFRWRLANAPGSPTQATVYRAFPGGWKSVLAAVGCESVP